jgi:hypothetical protein
MLRNPVSKRSVISLSLGLLALAALAAMNLALMPRAAQAYGGVPFKGTFTVAASVAPNTGGVTYCNGTAHALAVEAHGVGYSTLGALSLSLQKTIDVPGDMHGCLILTAPNGDTLSAIYGSLLDSMRRVVKPRPIIDRRTAAISAVCGSLDVASRADALELRSGNRLNPNRCTRSR